MNNELTFIIDNSNGIDFNNINCTYLDVSKDKTDKFRTLIDIILPKEDLINLFNYCNTHYPDHCIDSSDNGNYLDDQIRITFKNIDINMMNKIKVESKVYQEKLNAKNIILEKPKLKKKVIRSNRHKNATIAVSLTLLTVLTAVAVKHGSKNNKNKIDNSTKIITIDNENYDNKEKTKIVYYTPPTKEITPEPTPSITPESTPEPTIFTEDIMEEEENVDGIIKLETDNETEGEKYFITDAYYHDAITKTAQEFGLDPNLVIAIATHERGIHSETTDLNGGIGLFQIQIRGGWNWNGKEITAYDFNKEDYITETITEESASDIFQNIKLGCMMLQNSLVTRNYNIPLGVMQYNYGGTYLDKVLKKCSLETGYSIKELTDPNNLEWLNYRDIINGGDPLYLENVFKYIEDGTVLTFKTPDGRTLNYKYENLKQENKITRK